MSDWQSKIRENLAAGEQAREQGNEGMTRVCARRAAGWAANAFFEEQSIQFRPSSSFQRLLYLKESDLLSAKNKERLERLTLSLEKDDPQGDSHWPLEADLLDEARKLARALLPHYSI